MATQRLTRLVSDKALPDLKLLAADSDITLAVASALVDAKASLISSDIAESVSSSIGRSVDSVVPLVQIIWRLARLQRSLEMSAENLIAELTANLTKLPNEQWSSKDRENWDSIAPELIHVLSPGSAVYLGAKAYDLLMEQGYVLCAVQIVTDMRPIFDDEARELEGMIPFHTLILECHPDGDGSKHKTIRVAVDASDLQLIRDQIDRAGRKEQIIREQLDSNGYHIVGLPITSGETEAE